MIKKGTYLVGFELSVFNAINLTLLEYHLILSESTSFVAEYHFHLAQLLDQVRIPAL